MQQQRIIPITTVRIEDQGTIDPADDRVVTEVTYRIEVYEDGVDPTRRDARPILVYSSDNNVYGDADDSLITGDNTRVATPPVIMDDATRLAMIAAFETQLAGAYPGGPGLNPDLVAAMPHEVAVALVDAIARGDVDPALVDTLVAQAADRSDPDAAARAAAALFAIAFKHLDQNPDEWIRITGFDFLGDFGGNCAEFIGVAYLYAGFEQFGEFQVDPDGTMTYNGPPVLDNTARGAIGLAQMFATRGSYVSDPLALQVGDIILSDGVDHVSMVVGFGPADGRAGARVFATAEEAREFYGPDVALSPWVSDHDPSNLSTGARPVQRVYSGGDWYYVDTGKVTGG